jgi:hypothetical protein
MVQKCVPMHINAKMIPVETHELVNREIKGSSGRGEFKDDLVDAL